VVGCCLQYPFLRAGERFDIGANRSSQVTREVGLADLKAFPGALRQCYWIQHPTPLAVRSHSDTDTPSKAVMTLFSLILPEKKQME
jgi:hypothetical protein